MTPIRQLQFFLSICIWAGTANAQDKLVLELDLQQDLLSLSHNIDQFLFAPTRNFRAAGEENINNMHDFPELTDQLSATVLVRMKGEVVGFATEQEIISIDPQSQHPVADSLWVIRLNHPQLKGFMSVLQREDAHAVFSLAKKVAEDPEKVWEDHWHRFLSTSGEVTVQLASGDLSPYQGGVFQEFNYLNPSDLANYGSFRGRIMFVITPR